jgi:hypothetical protein
MIRHIVLVVIDCLRADNVSAGERVLWEHAVSTSSWTRPSQAMRIGDWKVHRRIRFERADAR